MNQEQARTFARGWIDAWNARDLDRVLAHYRDNFVMESPFITSIMNEPTGRLAGKTAVRTYWENALQRMPGLKFDLIDVLAGANSVVLYYQRTGGHRAAEYMAFDSDGLITWAAAHYEA